MPLHGRAGPVRCRQMSEIAVVVGREVLDSRGNPTVEVEVVARLRRAGSRHRPVGRVDRPVRGGRAARRRRPLRRQGRARRRRPRQRRDRRRHRGPRRPRPARRRPRADRPRRHRQQGPPRRQRHPRRVARRRQGRGRRARAAAVPLRRRRQRPRAAGADDERAQRRRPRRQQRRPAGVHDHAGRRARRSREALRWGAETLPRAEEGAARPRPVDGGRRRGRLRPEPRLERGRRPAAGRGHREAAGYTPGDDIAIALDPASSEFYARRRLRLAGEGRTLSRRRHGRATGRPRRPLPDRVDRGRHGRGGLGRLGRPHRARSATGCSSSATTCSSPTSSACDAASTRGVGQLDPGQGQPDRHAHRDARDGGAGDRAAPTPR